MKFLYTYIHHEDSPGNSQLYSVFPLKAVRLETSNIVFIWVFPGLIFGNQTITYCFPYAIYMRSIDISQNFPGAATLLRHANHLWKHEILNLTFLLKQSTGNCKPHFWFHPGACSFFDGFTGHFKTAFYTTTGCPLNC